jgi:hypothetical protein
MIILLLKKGILFIIAPVIDVAEISYTGNCFKNQLQLLTGNGFISKESGSVSSVIIKAQLF